MKLVSTIAVYVMDSKKEVAVVKRTKVDRRRETYVARFLTFCHHFFVWNTGANAEMVRKQWKEGEFPKRQVRDWFNQLRNGFRKRLQVRVLSCAFCFTFLTHYS